MRCKLRFPLLQHMISISTRSMFPVPAPPSPADFDPFPAPPRTVGREEGGGAPRPALWGAGAPRPAPPHRFLALPLPAPPREKNSFPDHPCFVGSVDLVVDVR